ncbi:MAG: GDP-L-fucose synthase [Candidatus Omnitrophica bacterium]|nr:GDP-L-fucose synthase [Candidatus Omnitrophota bacterium]
MLNDGLKIYVAGHAGLVGSALARRFSGLKEVHLVTAARTEVDLTDPAQVERFLNRERPDAVILAAGKVGGIRANASAPAQFIRENLVIEANLIHGSWNAGVKRLLNFGSGCMYPKACPQPMKPEHLMTGPMEPTSEPYSIAKLAGMVLCSSYNRQYGTRYTTLIPCTVYGPGDSFDPQDSHVLPALLRKFHEAKESGACEVTLWGSGQARREFLYADDLAEACERVLRSDEPSGDPINIGRGESISIQGLAQKVGQVVGFRGEVRWDGSYPDGAPEKRLDSDPIRRMGWSPRTDLLSGLEQTYRWYLQNCNSAVRAELVEARRSHPSTDSG